MRLFTYWRSSASYRVRIALGLKGLSCVQEPVHLVRDGGEQHKPAYLSRNPQGLVPALDLGDGQILTQSLAIIEYLDEAHPTPPLLPADAIGRARVRALAQAIACEIHPLNNLRVLGYLGQSLGADANQRATWYRHWVTAGLTAVEAMLAGSPDTGRFCHGDTPGLADCCLVPQVFNARRFDCDLDAFPTVLRVEAACLALPAVRAAAPEAQPDAD